jgi:hypothetical protein
MYVQKLINGSISWNNKFQRRLQISIDSCEVVLS